MSHIKNLLAFLLCIPLVITTSCHNKDDKTKDNDSTSVETQVVRIKPNDKKAVNYDNGQVQFTQEYFNEIKHGEYKDWYKNGQLRTVGYYNMGMRDGTWQWYSEIGKVTLQVNYNKSNTTSE